MAAPYPSSVRTTARGRRQFSALLGLMAVLGCGVLAASLRGPSAPLPAGTPFPALDLADWRTGAPHALGRASSPTVVILVRSGCSFCQDQLTEMAAHFDSLSGARYLFVTAEPSPPAEYVQRHPRFLAADASVEWVKAPASQLSAAFRTLATPSTFVYDGTGTLRRSFRGLTGVGAIAREITAIGPERTVARALH